jgi:hypothetical protein
MRPCPALRVFWTFLVFASSPPFSIAVLYTSAFFVVPVHPLSCIIFVVNILTSFAPREASPGTLRRCASGREALLPLGTQRPHMPQGRSTNFRNPFTTNTIRQAQDFARYPLLHHRTIIHRGKCRESHIPGSSSGEARGRHLLLLA